MSDRFFSVYYGWIIVAALFIILTFTSGLGFYNHSVILKAMTDQRGFSGSLASSAISLFFLTSGLAGLWISGLIEKYDTRMIMGVGGVLASLCLALLGHVTSVGELYVLYVLFGIGFSASSMLPATTLVARWFQKKRALALSIASTGLSVGGIVITPFSAILVGSEGLAISGYWFSAAYFIGVVPLSVLALRSRPYGSGDENETGSNREVRHRLQEARTTRKRGQPVTEDGIPFSTAFRDTFFWGMSLAYLFVMLAQVGAIAHQYGLIHEKLGGAREALALSILPLSSIVGRLGGGYFLDRLSMRNFTGLMMAIQALSLTGLALITNEWMLMLGLAAFGLSVGNLLMLQPLILTQVYGLRNYSRIYSVSNLLTTLGVALGPGLMGLIWSVSAGYDKPFLLAGVSGLVAFLIFTRVSGRRLA